MDYHSKVVKERQKEMETNKKPALTTCFSSAGSRPPVGRETLGCRQSRLSQAEHWSYHCDDLEHVIGIMIINKKMMAERLSNVLKSVFQKLAGSSWLAKLWLCISKYCDDDDDDDYDDDLH